MHSEALGAIVGVCVIVGLLTTCSVMNSGPCEYKPGEIIYRKLDGVRGIVVTDQGCHMSGRYSIKFTDSMYQQDITELELQKSPEIVK